MKKYALLIVLLGLGLFCSPAQAQKNDKKLRQDLDTMLTWFTGEFDNFQQVWTEQRDSVKKELLHEHIHSIFARVNVPAFGEHVFYVKQYMDGNPNKIYRQRLYAFRTNPQENAVQLDIWSFTVDSLYYDAHLKPEKLSGLSPDKMTMIPGCAVYWVRQFDKFIGYMKPKACNFISKRSGKKIFITDSLQLTRDEIWIRDEAEDEDGNYVFGHRAKIPHQLKRCRQFSGWMVVQMSHNNEYLTMRGINLHDQGAKVRCVDSKGQKTKYWIELSQVVYGKGQAVLKLAIYEDGKEEAIAYTWTNPEARQIGINVRNLQSGMTLVN